MSNRFANNQITFLNQWFEDVSSARIESLGVSGGFSGAVIWRVSTPGGDLCLRRWPQMHPTLDGLSAIHGLLAHVESAGFDRSPTPLATRGGDTIFVNEDHLWELTPWMPGEANFAQTPSATKLTAAMNTLVDFHAAARSYEFAGRGAHDAPSPGLQQRLATLRALQHGELDRLWKATRAAEANELRDMAFDLLECIARSLDRVADRLAPIADVPLPLQWSLRDVRHDHILYSGEKVTGLIDFGAAAVDSVAGDVARLLGSMVHDDADGWRDGIAAYDARRRLTQHERQAIASFDEGGVVCSAANWVRWLFVDGRSFPQVSALVEQLAWLRERLRALAVRCDASVSAKTWNPKPHSPSTSGETLGSHVRPRNRN